MTVPRSRLTWVRDRTACGRPAGPRSTTPTHALESFPRITSARVPSGEMRTAQMSPALSDSTLTGKTPSAPPATDTEAADVEAPHTHPKRSMEGPRGAAPGI